MHPNVFKRILQTHAFSNTLNVLRICKLLETFTVVLRSPRFAARSNLPLQQTECLVWRRTLDKIYYYLIAAFDVFGKNEVTIRSRETNDPVILTYQKDTFDKHYRQSAAFPRYIDNFLLLNLHRLFANVWNNIYFFVLFFVMFIIVKSTTWQRWFYDLYVYKSKQIL